MLLRAGERGTLAIGQTSHAWISGQLARAWGNERFPAPEPWEEVCLAAEQHDIGWADWDLDPARNADTGLPYAFTEMPLYEHLRMWTAGPLKLLAQSRYAALLISMHGFRLQSRRDLEQLDAVRAQGVRRYLDDQRRLQESLLHSLPGLDRAKLERASQLIWIWDFISLAVCLDWAPRPVRDVPTREEPIDLNLEPADGDRTRLWLEPWPFAADNLTVRCQGRSLEGPADSDEALRKAFADAPWETVEWELERRD
jgi:hypothetical protein